MDDEVQSRNPLLHWIFQNNYHTPAPDSNSSTTIVSAYTLLNGGNWYIPIDQQRRFYYLYSQSLNDGHIFFLNERATEFFPLFADLDIVHNADLTDGEIVTLIQEIQRVLKEKIYKETSEETFQTIICRNESKKVNNDNIKTGLHVHWPKLIVDQKIARQIGETWNQHFTEKYGEPTFFAGCSKWKEVFDNEVYVKQNLRLLESNKAEPCTNPLCKEEKRERTRAKIQASIQKNKREPQKTDCEKCQGTLYVDKKRPYKIWKVLNGQGTEDPAQLESYQTYRSKLLLSIGLRTLKTAISPTPDCTVLPQLAPSSKHKNPRSNLKRANTDTFITSHGKTDKEDDDYDVVHINSSQSSSSSSLPPTNTRRWGKNYYAVKEITVEAPEYQTIQELIESRKCKQKFFRRDNGFDRKKEELEDNLSTYITRVQKWVPASDQGNKLQNFYLLNTVWPWCPNVQRKHTSAKLWMILSPNRLILKCSSQKHAPGRSNFCSNAAKEKTLAQDDNLLMLPVFSISIGWKSPDVKYKLFPETFAPSIPFPSILNFTSVHQNQQKKNFQNLYCTLKQANKVLETPVLLQNYLIDKTLQPDSNQNKQQKQSVANKRQKIATQ